MTSSNADPPFASVRFAPKRVNRAHGPTKKYADIDFSIFPAHAKNGSRGPQMGPGGFLFLLIQTLPTFWAERIWILRILSFELFWISNSQISRSRKSGLGWVWSLGPAWALGLAGFCQSSSNWLARINTSSSLSPGKTLLDNLAFSFVRIATPLNDFCPFR